MRLVPIAAALAVTLGLTGGCATYAGSRTAAKVGGVTMLAGIAVWLVGAPTDLRLGFALAGGVTFALGTVVGGLGLVGMNLYDEASALPTSDASAEAGALAKQAIIAARQGDCSFLTRNDQQVLDLDSEVHEKVLVADPSIQKCFAIFRRRDEERLLLIDAGAAAEGGDCDAVKRIAAEVLAIDSEFHKTVFLADVRIARCLATASP